MGRAGDPPPPPEEATLAAKASMSVGPAEVVAVGLKWSDPVIKWDDPLLPGGRRWAGLGLISGLGNIDLPGWGALK